MPDRSPRHPSHPLPGPLGAPFCTVGVAAPGAHSALGLGPPEPHAWARLQVLGSQVACDIKVL